MKKKNHGARGACYPLIGREQKRQQQKRDRLFSFRYSTDRIKIISVPDWLWAIIGSCVLPSVLLLLKTLFIYTHRTDRLPSRKRAIRNIKNKWQGVKATLVHANLCGVRAHHIITTIGAIKCLFRMIPRQRGGVKMFRNSRNSKVLTSYKIMNYIPIKSINNKKR